MLQVVHTLVKAMLRSRRDRRLSYSKQKQGSSDNDCSSYGNNFPPRKRRVSRKNGPQSTQKVRQPASVVRQRRNPEGGHTRRYNASVTSRNDRLCGSITQAAYNAETLGSESEIEPARRRQHLSWLLRLLSISLTAFGYASSCNA
jgi:hypothetical protein